MRREMRRYRERRMNKTPPATLIEAFATYNRAKGHSPRTVSWYPERLEAFVRAFAPFLAEDGCHRLCQQQGVAADPTYCVQPLAA